MTNYKEILRLHSLGINNTCVAESCGCARSTVISTVQRAQEKGITWEDIRSLGEAEVARKLYPATSMGRQYKMPDYEYIHQEMQKSGVTLSLLWVEYCERCRANGELPYQSTQFNKYYADFVHKTKATMRLEHKPGETMQVDWAGQTAHIVDTDTGEQLDVYLFVAVLPYSGYAYAEAFLDMKQDDSCGEKAQSDALIVPFKNLINDAYCRDISVKIRSQLDIKRKMGDFIGAFAPYGYRKDEANRNRLVVDEEAARTVELIFRLRIQGLCNSAIADRLNRMGVLSPMEYKQAQGFNYSCGFRSNEQAEWSPMLVKRILSNEIYIGTLIQHKSGTPNHKIKKRVEYDRDEWIVIENNHEPIICRSDFDTVQNLMLRDVRTAPKQEKVHLFSGFVFCGDCKHTMVRKTVPSGGKKYHYLVCSTNKAGKGCSPHTFSEDKLKAIVLRVVNDHIELIAQVEQVLDYIASLPEQERRIINYDAQMTALENEIKRYQDLKINLYSDMADGVISREEYREFHAGYDRRIADRQRQLGKLKDERSQAMENSSGNIEWIEQFKKYRHLTELDRECIVHLIEKILIYDGKRIEVCFRYKDELENALQYIERFEDVLPAEEGVTMPERRNA